MHSSCADERCRALVFRPPNVLGSVCRGRGRWGIQSQVNGGSGSKSEVRVTLNKGLFLGAKRKYSGTMRTLEFIARSASGASRAVRQPLFLGRDNGELSEVRVPTESDHTIRQMMRLPASIRSKKPRAFDGHLGRSRRGLSLSRIDSPRRRSKTRSFVPPRLRDHQFEYVEKRRIMGLLNVALVPQS